MSSPELNHRAGPTMASLPYQDVPPNDDFDEEEDEEHLSPPRRRRSRAPPATITGSGGGVQCCLLYLLFALVVSAVGLIALRQTSKPTIASTSSSTHANKDKNAVVMDSAAVSKQPQKRGVIYYDSSVALHPVNPFDLDETDSTVLISPPVIPSSINEEEKDSSSLGYMMQPNIVNNTLVFISEGDLYLSNLKQDSEISMSAMKLTTTVGNVRTPKINPIYPYLIAYTATYTGRREVYVLDLRTSATPAMRLTYWSHAYGISSIVGWKDDGATLLFCAQSTEIGLPDTRLYQLSLEQDNDQSDDGEDRRQLSHGPLRVWQVEPVPLAQALDGVFDEDNSCIYFVRFAQSSNTIRYVGGTAESLWAWCPSRDLAIPLTTTYRGTDKQPSIVSVNKKKYLFFLSDRSNDKQNSELGSMNLWAMPLVSEEDLYSKNNSTNNKVTYTQLTRVSCDFDGKPLVEYSVDSITGNVVLRIGAEMHLLHAETIRDLLSSSSKGGGDETIKKKKKKDDDGNNKRQLKQTKGTTSSISKLPIRVYSDFHEQQERLIPVSVPNDVTTVDVYQTAFGGTSALLGLRGQLFVTPVIDDTEKVHPFAGAGMNLPPRRYRVAPGISAGGSVRIQAAKYVPLLMEKDARRLALILATDPKSTTAEHAFYLLETQSDAPQMFVNVENLPDPFLGGSKNGGSVADGGLGSVNADSVSVSPCGRRLAWTNLDGRICVMTMPMYQNDTNYDVLAQENEQGQPMIGTEADLSWSPGGRYLAVKHAARNQFEVISIADIGDPKEGKVNMGRIVQATSDRFNSGSMYWGRTPLDFNLKKQQEVLSQLLGKPLTWSDGATVLYYLSDRDLVADVKSPWGTRQPSPHFPKRFNVYALPLVQDEEQRSPLSTSRGTFGGGGASELWVDNILALQQFLEAAAEKAKQPTRHLLEAADKETEKDVKKSDVAPAENESVEKLTADLQKDTTPETQVDTEEPSPFPQDREIDFGKSQDLTFARRAYRLGNIPEGQYSTLFQPLDDPSIGVVESAGGKSVIKIFSAADFPSDAVEPIAVELETHQLAALSFTTTRKYLVFFFSPGNIMKVVPNSAVGLVSLIQDKKATKNIADTNELALSVWPALEYQQMYDDAWRMLRDYFYDPNMHGIDWPLIHARYRKLVKRCAKREELDDVLKQMAAELSALHVFVYGGEYGSPLHGNAVLDFVHETSSLGATLMRSAEWKGYVVTSIPERDPDFNLVDGKPMYSPLSNATLELTGQRGLQVGDVIVAVNGESVMRVPDIHMLLRGKKGRSVRLEVLRLASGTASTNTTSTRRILEPKNETKKKEEKKKKKKDEIALTPEPLVTVPISLNDAADLSYSAWEYKTRTSAQQLADDAGFTLGYIHLRSMSGPNDIDSFFRDFYPNYNKQALIMDVRHNRGGNIDSWLLDVLQRKAWMYWQSRTMNITTGGLGWDEQFAFRGHLVVLVDEHTASDGEGFSRGVSELGLGKIIGKRTWGGGIWLSSDNHLVDGGIATAPEVGTYNDKFGWGLGIEQMGVEPDVEVDNDPHKTFLGQDQQLERAVKFLQEWIKEEPVVLPKHPGPHPDRSSEESCGV